jgi:hypothetical protein
MNEAPETHATTPLSGAWHVLCAILAQVRHNGRPSVRADMREGSARFFRNEGRDCAWLCGRADVDYHAVQARILQACPDVVHPRQRVLPLGERRATPRQLAPASR